MNDSQDSNEQSGGPGEQPNDEPDVPDPAKAVAAERRRAYQESLQKARAFYEAKSWEEAIAEYTECRRLLPADSFTLIWLAKCLGKIGRTTEALATAEEAAEYAPLDPCAWEHIGYLRHCQKDFSGAEAAYRRTIEIAPWYAGGYAGVCNVLICQDKEGDSDSKERKEAHLLEEAEQLGSRAVSLDPDPAFYWDCLAFAREKLGMTFAARATWKTAANRYHAALAEGNTEHIGALVRVGKQLGDLGDWASAEWALSQAVTYKPDDLWLRAYLAHAHGNCRRYQQAAEVYQAVLDDPNLPPNDRPDFLRRTGTAWSKAGKQAVARTLLEQAVAANPEEALAWWWLGAVLHRSGDIEAGKKPRAEAIRLDSSLDRYLY